MSKDSPKTRRGLTLYTENPFLKFDTVKSKTRRVVNKRGDMMMVNSDTNEIVAPVAGFWQAQEVDSAQFIKLYINGVKAFSGLTPAGTKVFELLYMEMQKNIGKDRVYLSFTALEYEPELQVRISQATFTRGMKELMEKGFIAPTPAMNWYWLNPDYVFNGDRLAFVKEYRRVSEKKAKQQIPGQLAMSLLEQIDQGAGEVSE